MTQDLEFLKSSYEENNAFVKNNLSLFGEIDQRFRFVAPKNRLENADRLRESWLKGRDKRAYIAKISDQKVGYFYGEQQDASSFYMRVSVIDKKFRGQGIYSRFLDFFLSELKEAGYERVVSDHKPHNLGVLIPKLKAGFYIHGMHFDERWGNLVRLVYFPHQDRRKFYEDICTPAMP